MSNMAEVNRGKGTNRVRLTLNIDGLGRTIEFKSGGSVESPVRYNAVAAGGISAEGLYEPWLVEGEVTVDKSLAQWIMNVWQDHNTAANTTAILETYSTTGSLILKHAFNNVRVNKMPQISVEELSADSIMSIAFSVNDRQTSEVIDA